MSMDSDSSSNITTGVTGGKWRANVTAWGALEPWGGGASLDWHIAADDRWHSPQREAAVRQRRVDGTAVVETRVRIPDGDAIQRVYSVPDRGGLTIIEVENESPLPIAVAFTHGGLQSLRPPSAPIEGITLPEGSVAFPVGHRSTLTVALAHDGSGAGPLHGGLPTAAGVARGWQVTVDRASRLVLPDAALSERFFAERCELALVGPQHPDNDPVGFLLGVGQLVRMGEQATEWIPDVAHALELAAKSANPDWALAAALDAADHVLAVAGEKRARRDLRALSTRLAPAHVLASTAPDECAYFIAWVERLICDITVDGGQLLPTGFPSGWEGNNFEVYGVPTSALGWVSFAVRWHGERPAVLWEQSGQAVPLSAPAIAPAWRTTDIKGEALWPQPEGLVAAVPLPDTERVLETPPATLPVPGEGESFS
ncbi:MAG TPA: hypothetical protein PK020_11970 [Ilumatobacteraceae bacterium]|nr:hypothetical protein [Ilumatobacteraceae bacterium]HRB04247.1 hypothetical protein [Ilumatobacteraceae bacterium]